MLDVVRRVTTKASVVAVDDPVDNVPLMPRVESTAVVRSPLDELNSARVGDVLIKVVLPDTVLADASLGDFVTVEGVLIEGVLLRILLVLVRLLARVLLLREGPLVG